MRYLYYCNSTYQLLNILNLNYQRRNGFENIDDYHADLFVQNSFENADNIVGIISELNYFDNVRLINKSVNSGLFHSFATLLDAMSPSYYMKKKHGFSKKEIKDVYDVIVVPKYSVLMDQIYRLNKKAKLHLYEDGIGSYTMTVPLHSQSKRYRKLRNLFTNVDFNNYDRLYLINKSMYQGKDEDKVYEIPKYDMQLLEELENSFSRYLSKQFEDKDIYWLSQFLNNEEFNKMVSEVLECLVPYKEKTLFVQHPRTHLDNIHNFEETDGKQIFELQMLNVKDVDKKLLVSIHSTACFSGKMLFDKEPYIIMFYRLGDREVSYVTDEFEEIVERFKNSYRNPEKVMIPETIEEFRECVRFYLNDINSD